MFEFEAEAELCRSFVTADQQHKADPASVTQLIPEASVVPGTIVEACGTIVTARGFQYP
jgi:hypothetical protein